MMRTQSHAAIKPSYFVPRTFGGRNPPLTNALPRMPPTYIMMTHVSEVQKAIQNSTVTRNVELALARSCTLDLLVARSEVSSGRRTVPVRHLTTFMGPVIPAGATVIVDGPPIICHNRTPWHRSRQCQSWQQQRHSAVAQSALGIGLSRNGTARYMGTEWIYRRMDAIALPVLITISVDSHMPFCRSAPVTFPTISSAKYTIA